VNPSPETQDAPVLKYIGNGASIWNIPARDLTQRDLDDLYLDLEKLIRSGLYAAPEETHQ
jgi:hypothetical protein